MGVARRCRLVQDPDEAFTEVAGRRRERDFASLLRGARRRIAVAVAGEWNPGRVETIELVAWRRLLPVISEGNRTQAIGGVAIADDGRRRGPDSLSRDPRIGPKSVGRACSRSSRRGRLRL